MIGVKAALFDAALHAEFLRWSVLCERELGHAISCATVPAQWELVSAHLRRAREALDACERLSIQGK